MEIMCLKLLIGKRKMLNYTWKEKKTQRLQMIVKERKAENNYDVEHIANANDDDADDKIRMKNVSTGEERKSLLFLIPHLKEKNLSHHQGRLLK